ncbi:MAG: hypothetical protein IJH87_04535, partial [Atopobiaceae bacterium]|nr:hypothetical protein [Atopobiaceae bacterium]
MVFSSNIFLFIFMPLFFAVYWMLPTIGLKNIFLLLGSLVFYAWGEPVFICLLVVSILVNWAFGCALADASKSEEGTTGEGHGLLIAAIVFN